MLNCREVTRLSSEESERELNVQERIAMRLHTMMCSGCRNFRRQMGFLHRATERYRNGGRPDGDE